jgi:hypothetical protein
LENRGKDIHHGFTWYELVEVTAFLSEAGFRDVQFVFGRNRFGDFAVVEGKK